MLEELSAQSTSSSGKAGVRPKKQQRETGASLDAIEELKEELNSTYTKTSKDIERILRYIQLNEFDDDSPNSSQSKSKVTTVIKTEMRRMRMKKKRTKKTRLVT